MSVFGNRAQWVTKPLVDVATLQRGYDLPVQDRTPGPHPIFAANGPVGSHRSAKCKGPGVVTGRSGTIGKLHFVAQDYWPLNTSLYVKDFHGNDPKWVYYMLQSFRLEDYSQGAGVPTLNRNLVHGEPVKVPPLKEQRRIAAILDQAETLRTQRRQALAHLDTLTQSLFLDMFGDPMDLPKRWTFRPMANLFETTPIFGTMIPGDVEGGPWLCLRVANIQDWQLTLEDRKYVNLPESAVDRHSVKAGDLLMARAIASQDHLGKCIVAQPGTEQWAFDSHLMRLRFRADRALPDFIRQMLRTPGGRKLFLKASRKSSVQYNINTKEISALEIPVPPIALQQTFATRIAAIESLKATHRSALAQLDALFASLQHRAFAGEL